jgi:hypothetical protein
VPRRVLYLLSLLSACRPGPDAAVWTEKMGFEWEKFNHRLSFLELLADGDAARAGVIGGASTTGIVPELPDSCEASACAEIPMTDTAAVALGWARSESEQLVFATAGAELVADAAGVSDQIRIPLPRRATGRATVLMQGLWVDGNVDVGQGCYDPSAGWLLRHLHWSLDDTRLSSDGLSVVTTFEAAFEAGLSFEPTRACMDEVVPGARAHMGVRVLAVAGETRMETVDVTHGLAYAYTGNLLDPGDQAPPDLADRPLPLDLERPMAGFASVDFRFQAGDEDGRGAYLRSLSIGLDTDQGWASGHATSYSPLTQLSSFSYAFEGRISAVELSEAPERSKTVVSLSAAFDEQGRPVVTAISLY